MRQRNGNILKKFDILLTYQLYTGAKGGRACCCNFVVQVGAAFAMEVESKAPVQARSMVNVFF
jgi:hypothetical protein